MARRAIYVAPLVLGLALCGCSRSSNRTPNADELRLERKQFLLVIDGLRSAQSSVALETQGAHATWPAIVKGLPRSPPPALRRLIAQTSVLARQLVWPAFMASVGNLTGPAAGLAGLYEDFARLAERGWRITEASIGSIVAGPPAASRFARANSSLYIYAIYDSHYDLSLVGKSISDGYKRLGGAPAFGAKLTLADVTALAHTYSIRTIRLTPHPPAPQ